MGKTMLLHCLKIPTDQMPDRIEDTGLSRFCVDGIEDRGQVAVPPEDRLAAADNIPVQIGEDLVGHIPAGNIVNFLDGRLCKQFHQFSGAFGSAAGERTVFGKDAAALLHPAPKRFEIADKLCMAGGSFGSLPVGAGTKADSFHKIPPIEKYHSLHSRSREWLVGWHNYNGTAGERQEKNKTAERD